MWRSLRGAIGLRVRLLTGNLTKKTKRHEQATAKKEMLEAQAKAMVLDEKLREARERLKGLQTLPPKSDEIMSESTESGSDQLSEGDETHKIGQCNSVVDGSSQELDSKSITAGFNP